jgi:hypothetical protein
VPWLTFQNYHPSQTQSSGSLSPFLTSTNSVKMSYLFILVGIHLTVYSKIFHHAISIQEYECHCCNVICLSFYHHFLDWYIVSSRLIIKEIFHCIFNTGYDEYDLTK